MKVVDEKNRCFKDIVDVLCLCYPVGSSYINFSDSRNPSEILGFGTWEQVKDKFILAVGDTYEINTTGGEATHILTEEEIPNHRHDIYTEGGTVSKSTKYIAGASGSIGGQGVGYTQYNGGGKAHNNMPPYETAYCWKRIA